MRAVLLTGSPRGTRSTSRALGLHVLQGLRSRGWEVEERNVCRAVTTAEGVADLKAIMEGSDLAVLSLPIYLGSPPAAVMRAMEALRGHIKEGGALVAVTNSDLVGEREHEVSLSICRLFARDIGWEWRGGIVRGGQVPRDRAAGTVELDRRARRALDLAVEELSVGRPLPAGTVDASGRRPLPALLHVFRANGEWGRAARSNKVRERIRVRPYLEERR